MKKTFLSLIIALGSISSVSAATLITDNYSSGFTLADGTTALSSGILRFGTFVVSDSLVQANAGDLTYLATNFRSVVSYTGAINAVSTDGFFDNTTLGALATYTGGATTYGGTTYDLSTSSTANVANDIAGSNIYVWVLNSDSSQQAIFKSLNIWTDTDVAIPNNSSSVDVAPTFTTALVGTLDGGADIGAGAPSHSLAGVAAIPEPSRALLGLAGLGALFFRRRRA